MSDPSVDRPRDRRRSRGQSSGTAGSGSESQAAAGSGSEPVDEIVVSRTAFSYLEPVLGTIGTFGAPLVIAGVVSLAAGITLVLFVSSMRLYGVINIVLGIVLIGLVALIFFSSVLAAFFSRTGRYGLNSFIMMAAFTGIILVIGIIGFEKNSRIDLTATNQFSLSGEAKDLLGKLEEPVRATAFYKSNLRDNSQIVRRVKVEETLQEFAARSSKFSYRIVDPDLSPDIASKYFGARPVDFVAESVVVEGLDSDIFDVIEPRDQSYSQLEQDLVTSMRVATGREQKTIYFLTGHGERSIVSSASDGYGQLKAGLEHDNYRVESLLWDPAEDNVEIPEDAALMVIARPTGELPDAHAQVLDLYLQGKDLDASGNVVGRREGGRLIFLAEGDTDETFLVFLARWGVGVGSGYIRDVGRSVPANPQTLRLSDYNYGQRAPLEITSPRGEPLEVTFMPGATALIPLDDGLRRPSLLARTSEESYLISDTERTDPIIDKGDESDPQGPFFPAILVEDAVSPIGVPPPVDSSGQTSSSLVVFGDSDFVANSFFERGGGADLFLNSTNYLLGDISLVSIRDKAFTFREFNLNKNEYKFVQISSLAFVPGLLGLMAALVWWVRR